MYIYVILELSARAQVGGRDSRPGPPAGLFTDYYHYHYYHHY